MNWKAILHLPVLCMGFGKLAAGFAAAWLSKQVSSMSSCEVRLLETLPGGVQRYGVILNDETLTQHQVFSELVHNQVLQEDLGNVLRKQPQAGFFFETPGMTLGSSLITPFEFVTVPSPTLERVAHGSYDDFADVFARDNEPSRFVVFPNLGGDALLLAPRPRGEVDYPHIGGFLERAPAEDARELFRLLGEQVVLKLEREPSKPVWVSTAGTGTYWLHVRLDDRPKYYSYAPYRALPF